MQIFHTMISPLNFVLSLVKSHRRVYTNKEASFRKITVAAVWKIDSRGPQGETVQLRGCLTGSIKRYFWFFKKGPQKSRMCIQGWETGLHLRERNLIERISLLLQKEKLIKSILGYILPCHWNNCFNKSYLYWFKTSEYVVLSGFYYFNFVSIFSLLSPLPPAPSIFPNLSVLPTTGTWKVVGGSSTGRWSGVARPSGRVRFVMAAN